MLHRYYQSIWTVPVRLLNVRRKYKDPSLPIDTTTQLWLYWHVKVRSLQRMEHYTIDAFILRWCGDFPASGDSFPLDLYWTNMVYVRREVHQQQSLTFSHSVVRTVDWVVYIHPLCTVWRGDCSPHIPQYIPLHHHSKFEEAHTTGETSPRRPTRKKKDSALYYIAGRHARKTHDWESWQFSRMPMMVESPTIRKHAWLGLERKRYRMVFVVPLSPQNWNSELDKKGPDVRVITSGN